MGRENLCGTIFKFLVASISRYQQPVHANMLVQDISLHMQNRCLLIIGLHFSLHNLAYIKGKFTMFLLALCVPQELSALLCNKFIISFSFFYTSPII